MAEQMSLSLFDLSEAVQDFAAGNADERGEVFTRRNVVEFILNLSGYTVDKPLHSFRLLEPSFGRGDFLLPAVDRLFTAYKKRVADFSSIFKDLSSAIRAIEVNGRSIKSSKATLVDTIRRHGVSERDTGRLVDAWLIEGDFLLVDLPHAFTHAVGNPPYVRQEHVPDALMAEYRLRYSTIFDRADLYVPFIERCLTYLERGGSLGFICADRWVKNKYGGPLRAMVARDYHLVHYVDMADRSAFHSEVTAYPAITIIKREKPGPTRIAHPRSLNQESLLQLAQAMTSGEIPKGSGIVEVEHVPKSSEPWIVHSFDRLAVVRRLETDFPAIEEAGCRVGIGVATGADKVFIGPFEGLDVEPDRKLPLVKTKDIQGGTVEWQGLGVINPFHSNGGLVDLRDYPRLARYFERHSDAIRKRNCARKNPNSWYRTIDRIYPALTYQPKLLIPDIKGEAHVVFENGRLYPHHNLYFVTSEDWDLRALQAVLLSGIAKLFVSVYSTKMRGGYLRFQAQYLRRIRIPPWKKVPGRMRETLVMAANKGDVELCNSTAYDIYRLTPGERDAIAKNGD